MWHNEVEEPRQQERGSEGGALGGDSRLAVGAQSGTESEVTSGLNGH